MQSNRVMAENKIKEKTRITLYHDQFDFAKSLRVGSKGVLNIKGVISQERQVDEKEDTTKTLRVIAVKNITKDVKI